MSDTVTLEVIHILNIILMCNFYAFLTKNGLCSDLMMVFKGSTGQSHFIFEINVGKCRIRHRMTL